jgi:hypothetical protein
MVSGFDVETLKANSMFKSINYPNLEIDPSESLDPKDLKELDPTSKSIHKKGHIFKHQLSSWSDSSLYVKYINKSMKKAGVNTIFMRVFDDKSVAGSSESKWYEFEISLDATLNEILIEVFRLKYSSSTSDSEALGKFVKSYVLCMCGCDEIIYSSQHKLGAYKVFALKLFLYLFRIFEGIFSFKSDLKRSRVLKRRLSKILKLRSICYLNLLSILQNLQFKDSTKYK